MNTRIKFLVLGAVFLNAISGEEFGLHTVDLAALPCHDDSTVHSSTRIVGGSDTTIAQYPYTVQVLYANQLLCGGSILSQRHVLSAAHCFFTQSQDPIDIRQLTVRAGSDMLPTGNTVIDAATGGVSIRVSSIAVHGSYNSPVRDNDIAVIVLASSLTFGGNIAYAAIPSQGSVVPDDSEVTHVGWGVVNVTTEAISARLQEVHVRTVARGVCAARYAQLAAATNIPFPVTDNMICAGILDIGGKDACQGDSGGPLIYNAVVVGITSWGQGCGHPFYPGVSVRVASYSNWIASIVNSSPALGSVSYLLLITSLLITLLFSKTS